jgi:hypothetical protein
VPDLNYCCRGVEGWVELKRTDANAVDLSPHQVAWIDRRVRCGGRVHILVRRREDQLWLLPGSLARRLATREERLPSPAALGVWDGGPSSWDWRELGELILR